MGRPTQRQVDEGQGFLHRDRADHVFWVTDTFTSPVLGVGVGKNQAILDRDAVEGLCDFLDQWLLKFPPDPAPPRDTHLDEIGIPGP